MRKTVTRLLALIAISLIAAPTIASAEPPPNLRQSSSSSQVYIDEYGVSHVQTETTTVLPAGVIQQQTYSSSSQSSALVQYRTICNQGQCQFFALYCQSGVCEFRQAPIFYIGPLPGER